MDRFRANRARIVQLEPARAWPYQAVAGFVRRAHPPETPLSSLTLQSVSTAQLLAMGDGLLATGDLHMARGMYGVALARAAPDDRQRIRTRIGLAAAPNARTKAMLGLLKELEGHGFTNAFVGDGMATWLKTLPFAEDDRFQQIAERHAELLPLANWHWNLQTVLWAVDRNRRVEGDYVELGVFKGHTTLFCSDYLDFGQWPKRWLLYDTFDGIPEEQQAPGWKSVNEALYKGKYSFEEVRDRFARFPNIQVIQGKVPDIFAQTIPERIAFLHIDLNNAPAEIAALDALYDRITPGGIIIFDDYTWWSTRAQYHAEKAWFARKGLAILPLPTGQGLFVKP